MFGINLSGAEFGSGIGRYGYTYIYPSASTIKYYADQGVDFIRLPFKWERLQNALNGELNQAELSRIKSVLDAAQANGLKVILDVHNFGAYNGLKLGSGDVPVSAFQDLWGKLATALKNYPALDGYGLMNEPEKALDWPSAAQAAINTIRAVDVQTPIYVAGMKWGAAQTWQNTSDMLKNLVDPSGKLVFEAHQYFDKYTSGTYQGTYESEGAYATVGVDRLQSFIMWLKDNNLKGFIGEYAVPDNDPRWLTVMDNFLQELSKNNIPSAYWGGGPWWGDYPMSIEPNGGVESAQMTILKKNIAAYEAILADRAGSLPAEPVVIPVYDATGSAKNDTMAGKTGYLNTLHGNDGHDKITGADLDDKIYGGTGNDAIWGNGGNDHLYGETGEDKIYGGAGHDVIDGGEGKDYIEGGDGDDMIIGGGAKDSLYGNAGDDYLDGGADHDYLDGGDGNDRLDAGDGDDKLYGGAGDDVLNGAAGKDLMCGGDGNDALDGGDGDDKLYGDAGDDAMNGGNGKDTLYGGVGNDVLYGGNESDTLYGEAGNDQIEGGSGKDVLYGQDGMDSLYGGGDSDVLYGGSGADYLDGGADIDKIYGDDGNDILYGGGGADSLAGGSGADIFLFLKDTAFTGVVKIVDFNRGEDKINLSDLLQSYDPVTSAITHWVQITTKGKDSILSVDVDGGGNHFVQVATIASNTGLTDEQTLVKSGVLII